MTERFEHLELPSHVEGFVRQKPGGFPQPPPPRTDEEKKEISEIQVQHSLPISKNLLLKIKPAIGNIWTPI